MWLVVVDRNERKTHMGPLLKGEVVYDKALEYYNEMTKIYRNDHKGDDYRVYLTRVEQMSIK